MQQAFARVGPAEAALRAASDAAGLSIELTGELPLYICFREAVSIF